MFGNRLLAVRILVSRALDVPVDSVVYEASIQTLDAWDSLGHMRIILEIEQSLGIELQSEQILEIETLEDVARILDCGHAMSTDELDH